MPEKRRSTGYLTKDREMACLVRTAGRSGAPYPFSLIRRSCRRQNRRRVQDSKWSSSVACGRSAVLMEFDLDIRPRALSAKFIAALPAQLDGRGAASEKTAPLMCGSQDAARHA